jgi:hypothetical protein
MLIPGRRRPAPQESLSVPELLASLNRVHPRYTQPRVAAVSELCERDLTSRERETVLAVLRDILVGNICEVEQPAFRGLLVASGVGAFFASVPWLESMSQSGASNDAVAGVVLIVFSLTAVLAAPLTVSHQIRNGRNANDMVRAACAEALCRLGDRDSLILVTEAARGRVPALSEGAKKGLASLLPIMLSEGTPVLGSAESVSLALALRGLPPGVAATALEVLEIGGASAALDIVSAYAGSGLGPLLAEKARRAIARLEERREVEGSRATLLRPSKPQDESNLLRAAASTAAQDPAVLLRPTTEE